MLPNRTEHAFLTQLWDVLLMELSNWRWSWRTLVLTSTITPLLGIVGLGVFSRGGGQETLAAILTGNVVLALMFGTMDKVQSRFVFMRVVGTLDYYATLPIRQATLILASVLSFLLLSLPSVVVTIVIGSLLLGLPLHLNPLILLVVPLCAVPLSAVGALIATYARTPEESGALSLLATFIQLGLGPVVVPASRLPQALIIAGHFSPATYAASALRQTLLGSVTAELLLDLAVLVAVSIVIFWLVGRKLSWRQR